MSCLGSKNSESSGPSTVLGTWKSLMFAYWVDKAETCARQGMSFCVGNSLCWGASLSEPNNPKQDFPLWWLGVQALTEPSTYTCQLIKTCLKGQQKQFRTGSTWGGHSPSLWGPRSHTRFHAEKQCQPSSCPDALFCASVTNRGSAVMPRGSWLGPAAGAGKGWPVRTDGPRELRPGTNQSGQGWWCQVTF